MKLLLVDNLLFEGDPDTPAFDPQPHLGLMSLVAVAHGAGHHASILNPRQLLLDGKLKLGPSLYATLAQIISDAEADAVGFTALGCNIHCVVQTAQALRRISPDRPVLLGGPHATILHRELLDAFGCFDIIARHEAEHSLPLVLDALEADKSLSGIPGISFRSARGLIVENSPAQVIEDLDALPVPSYEAYPLHRLGLGEIRVEAGRGCPFSCTFCSTATFFGRRYRLKSATRLVSEMDMLAERYGFLRFKLNHDLFTVNRKLVLAFCEAVSNRGYEWSCSARMDCVDAPLLEAMAKSGCRDIYFGVEAGSSRMQEITKKRLDLGLIAPTLAETARLSIRTTTSFITGYPEENMEDLDSTLDAVGEAHQCASALNVSQLHLLTPEPGTELMARHGGTLRLDAHVSEFNFPRLAPEDDDLLRRHPGIFPNHYHFPTQIARARLIFTTDLWPVLYELDRPVLAYLIAWHGGRLSRLADGFYSWSCRQMPEMPPPGLASLAAYVAERFGAGAPVSSVARFAALLSAFKRVVPEQDGAAERNTNGALRLSHAVRLLPDCHDVPALLAEQEDLRIYGADNSARSLSDWLLLRKDGQVRLFAIGAETLEFLGMFSKPVTYDEVLRTCLLQGRPAATPEDVAALVDLGALVRIAEAAGQDAA
ncbi:radical SAM protein [Frigidibacter sp. MR17.14]|uniref:B12-binding domain-containing radical SAM protein n=1 Tax=Frigidibacter sp. MR17.14 TaxID=3126509 RepID=UPI003012C937